MPSAQPAPESSRQERKVLDVGWLIFLVTMPPTPSITTSKGQSLGLPFCVVLRSV